MKVGWVLTSQLFNHTKKKSLFLLEEGFLNENNKAFRRPSAMFVTRGLDKINNISEVEGRIFGGCWVDDKSSGSTLYWNIHFVQSTQFVAPRLTSNHFRGLRCLEKRLLD